MASLTPHCLRRVNGSGRVPFVGCWGRGAEQMRPRRSVTAASSSRDNGGWRSFASLRWVGTPRAGLCLGLCCWQGTGPAVPVRGGHPCVTVYVPVLPPRRAARCARKGRGATSRKRDWSYKYCGGISCCPRECDGVVAGQHADGSGDAFLSGGILGCGHEQPALGLGNQPQSACEGSALWMSTSQGSVCASS